jgi:hypothetical protein
VAACYFDVDGTLVRTNLIQPSLYYFLNQGTPVQTAMRLGRALVQAPSMMLAELRDRRVFNELLYSAYAGMSEDRLLLLSEEVFDDVLRPALFPQARALSRRVRRRDTRSCSFPALSTASCSTSRVTSAAVKS